MSKSKKKGKTATRKPSRKPREPRQSHAHAAGNVGAFDTDPPPASGVEPTTAAEAAGALSDHQLGKALRSALGEFAKATEAKLTGEKFLADVFTRNGVGPYSVDGQEFMIGRTHRTGVTHYFLKYARKQAKAV